MHYARDLQSGKIVAADDARHGRAYACARPGCDGQVYLPHVSVQRPHFRHYPGEGTTACDEYYPGWGSAPAPDDAATQAPEEQAPELALLLSRTESRWTLGLHLPEISSDQLGAGSLAELRRAFVDVFAGAERFEQISALDLRPGVGVAWVDAMPSLQSYRTNPAGTWPASVDQSRWALECSGLEATGVLFRLRGGVWTRLRAGSAIYPGETLALLADTRCKPPESIVTEMYAQIASGGLNWATWDVVLPSELGREVVTWIARLGHKLQQRPWSLEPVTPSRARTEKGELIYWLGDSVVLHLRAPRAHADVQVTLKFGTNFYTAVVQASASADAFLAVDLRDVGPIRLSIAGEQTANLEFSVVQRPSQLKLLEQACKAPKLRMWINELNIEAWPISIHEIATVPNSKFEVLVDLGSDCSRANVTIWEGNTRRVTTGLDARNVAKSVIASLLSASRIEVDAGNFGRIELVPKAASRSGVQKQQTGAYRLQFYENALRLVSIRKGSEALDGSDNAAALKTAGRVALVRSRLARRRQFKGSVGE